MSEPGKRIRNHGEIDDSMVCYWKNNETGNWYIYLPYCGAGNLSNHTIEEHEDGTITVSPSILMDGHRDGEKSQRHGFLVEGVWNEC